MPVIRRWIATVGIAVVGLQLATVGMQAQAQTPTTAQRNAIRQYCASDYQAMCSGVPPGGRASLQCLQGHMAELSQGCQSAVGALTPQGPSQGGYGSRPPAAPVAGRPAQACRADFRTFCGGIRPGGGRAIMCLREHAAELSPYCQASLEAMRR